MKSELVCIIFIYVALQVIFSPIRKQNEVNFQKKGNKLKTNFMLERKNIYIIW